MSKELTKQETKREQVYDLLNKWKGYIAKSLPKHITPERMVSVGYSAMSRNPRLMECTSDSLVACFVEASQAGWDLAPTMKHCYLVPFKNNKVTPAIYECKLLPGYGGMADVARRTGEIKAFDTDVVYEGDDFDYRKGTQKYLNHKRADDCSFEDKNLTHAYAVVEYVNGGTEIEVMTVIQLEKVRKMSKAPDSDAYKYSLPEMYRKAALKRLCKKVPMSSEYRRVAMLDDLQEIGKQKLSMENFNKDTLKIDFPMPEQPEDTGDEKELEEPVATTDNQEKEPETKPEATGKKKPTPRQEFNEAKIMVDNSNKKIQKAYYDLMNEYLTKLNITEDEMTDAQLMVVIPEIKKVLK